MAHIKPKRWLSTLLVTLFRFVFFWNYVLYKMESSLATKVDLNNHFVVNLKASWLIIFYKTLLISFYSIIWLSRIDKTPIARKNHLAASMKHS